MKSIRNLFRSKKDEKFNENGNCKMENARLPSMLKSQPPLPPLPRRFNDDMNLLNPSAAYHTDNIRPSTRRPLRSCPGGVSNSRSNMVSDSDNDEEDNNMPHNFEKQLPQQQQRHQQRYRNGGGGMMMNSKNFYGHEQQQRRNYSTKFRMDSPPRKITSEYGSGEHSPISNVLRFGYEDSYYQKYRKYKDMASRYHKESKEMELKVRNLQIQLDNRDSWITNLKEKNMQLQKHLQSYQNYCIPPPPSSIPKYAPYPSYYNQCQQQQYAPPHPMPLQPTMMPPPLLPPPISYSTAPTAPIGGFQPDEFDDVKKFRMEDNESKPVSRCSNSSVSITNFDYQKFQSNLNLNRIDSHSSFNNRENLPPPPSALNDVNE